MIKAPTHAEYLIQKLQAAGHKAYFVGGCVRDSIRGVEPHDWDICTSATPEEMLNSIFLYEKALNTSSAKYGMVPVIFDSEDGTREQYEVTTFRTDSGYSDSRHPDSVILGCSITEDLSRRDFTVNAIAYSEQDGFIDPYNGIDDIKAGIIRCVGDPYARFSEDALRILRALRFSSVLGYQIDNFTAKAIHDLAESLNNVSAERIQVELLKLLAGKDRLRILLDYSDVIAVIVPELKPCIGFNQNNRYHCYTVYEHIAHVVDACLSNNPVLLMAALLHDIGKPLCYTENETGGHFYGHGEPSAELAAQAVRRLRFDNHSSDRIVELVRIHDTLIEPTKKSVRRFLSKISDGLFELFAELRFADISAHAPNTQDSRKERLQKVCELYHEIQAEASCFTVKNLAVSGSDIMTACGLKSGPKIGVILRQLLDAVIDEQLENNREELLREAVRIVGES